MDGEVDVVVVGAGPAGLMLAGELGLAGVRVMVLERHERRRLDQCRGFNLNARSLELLDRRGIAGRFLAEGPAVPYWMFGDPSRFLDLSAMETDHPYALGIPQTRVEELLEEWVGELGMPVHRGCEVSGLEVDDRWVTVAVGGRRVRAAYVAGCDGSRSTVRRLAGIGFPGTAAGSYSLLGDVVLAEPDTLPFGMTQGENGAVFVIPRPGYVRIVTKEAEPPVDRDEPVTVEHFQGVLDHVLGRRVAIGEARWLTRFGDAARQAERYVAGRVVLAGDAAHIHPPAGAVGVNVALADAVNLGWKLAATVQGWAPAGLLETYHTERHAAGELVLRHTQVQALLGGDDPRLDPLRELFTELTALPPVNRYLAELTTGLSTQYDVMSGGITVEGGVPSGGAGSEGGAGTGGVTSGGEAAADVTLGDGVDAWLGRLAANLPLTVNGERTSVARLLHPARGVLIQFGESPPVGGLPGHVDVHLARRDDHPDLETLLIRPDGHTAWLATRAGHRPAISLSDALARWFGDDRGRQLPG